ncbi:hypothetical protein [Gemmata sp.]|uniref:hypothetical protein n=1 Tax=Gemmata sp. TaxID=1914242 RepID=UPI003F6F6503
MACWRVSLLLTVAVGCHHTRPAVAPRPGQPTAAPVARDLPLTEPVALALDGRDVPVPPARTAVGVQGDAFRKLTERDCVLFAAASSGAANLLDEGSRVPPRGGDCDPARDELQRSVRTHAALELRNRAAADALERFFQLADAEARGQLLRDGFPVLDGQLDRAKKAQAAGIRFPLDVGELTRKRSQLATDLEQTEHASRLLNLDLKRRLGLPYQPAAERLWPAADFAVDPAARDAEAAVAAALADRPELRGLRALYHGLTPDTLPDVRELLKANSALPNQRLPLTLRRLLGRDQGPDPAALAELEVRRKQLLDLIAERERAVADETRAALLDLDAQVTRIGRARERLAGLEVKLADAVKQRLADQPGAELLEAHSRTEVLKARAEVVAEVVAWHQARVRLRAAQGAFAWEAAPGK